MKNFIAYLQDASDNLSDLLGVPREDFQEFTDETLDEMYMEYAYTHAAPNTTPIF